MRLLDVHSFHLVEYFEPEIPPYAILSHRWEAEEVLFNDLSTPNWRCKAGARKILLACNEAKPRYLSYIWVDTCCIDKSSSAELSEAINSMFRWYARSQIRFAFLSDVIPNTNFTEEEYENSVDMSVGVDDDTSVQKDPFWSGMEERWAFVRGSDVDRCDGGFVNISIKDPFLASAWFTRGWTLQELIAPAEVEFFDTNWTYLGSRSSLAAKISQACGVDLELLRLLSKCECVDSKPHGVDSIQILLQRFSVAQKMSWAAKRRCTRVEDHAYSLLGLFGVYMPLMYGEGRRAFVRLQEELLKSGNDLSVLAWGSKSRPLTNATELLAESPADFVDCRNIVRSHKSGIHHSMTNAGFRIEQPFMTVVKSQDGTASQMALSLGCQDRVALTKTISLKLSMVNSDDRLFCVDIDQGWSSRIKTTEIEEPRQSSEWPFATILRHHYMKGNLYQAAANYHTHILIKLPALRNSWKVLETRPWNCWNSDESCIDLSKLEARFEVGSMSEERRSSILLSRLAHEHFVLHFEQRFAAEDDTVFERLSFGISRNEGTRIPVTPKEIRDEQKTARPSNFDDDAKFLVDFRSIKRPGMLIGQLEVEGEDDQLGEDCKLIERRINTWPSHKQIPNRSCYP